MAWDPNVPNRVYLGNDGGMYRSDANGDSGWIHGTNMPWLQEYHVAVSQTAAEPDRDRAAGQRLEPQLVERQRRGRRPGRRELGLVRRR